MSAGRWRAAASVLVSLGLAVGFAGRLVAQQKEWYDLYSDATKIIENSKASEDQLYAARRYLIQALRSEPNEGRKGTYNQNVRINYLPHFYMGWANMRLGRYDDAAKDFAKSAGDGFITKGAPADLRAKFESFDALVPQLGPAARALSDAKKNGLAKQCVANNASASGKTIRETIATIEKILAAPKAENAAGLKSAMSTLETAQTECAKEIRGEAIARLTTDFNAARDAVAVAGVEEFLGAASKAELDGAVKAGTAATSKGDENGIQAATKRLHALAGKVGGEVDAHLAGLARDAQRLVSGNMGALNEKGQMGTRLSNMASRTASTKAAGKTGAGLAEIVKAGNDLSAVLDQARQALQPILKAKASSLGNAVKEFDAWSSSHACDIKITDLRGEVSGASKDAASALHGDSADAMDEAVGTLKSARSSVEERMKAALPKMESQATGALANADDLIKNIPSASDRQRGDGLKSDIQRAVSAKDACGIQDAIDQLNKWVKVVAPELEQKRNAAIARNASTLSAGQDLLNGFGGILKAETIQALKGPVETLAGLVKNSYDTAAIDKAGKDLKGVVETARSELKGQMEAGVQDLKRMRQDPLWTSSVDADRRNWLESNLPAVEKAVLSTSNPELLARFAREYPRARLELAVDRAFDSLYEKDDPGGATKVLEDLGPGILSSSAAVNYALAYCYWWQGRAGGQSDSKSLMSKAREAYQKGEALKKVDLTSLGASLFAPAFVQEMSAR